MKCPCGTGNEFENCCGPFLEGAESPSTPEQLMRSRYTAFAMKKIDYIAETMDPQVRLEFDLKANQEWAQSSQFLKLEVLQTSQEGNKGQVEFKAWFKTGDGPEQIHHEFAKFRKQSGIWYFKDGRSVTKEVKN